MKKEKRAACLIIGDEILTGKVHDVNSHILAQVLFERGVRLMRIETVADIQDQIVEAVRRMKSEFDLVFTSGGIGPTHDDITYESIAAAFGVELRYHEDTLALMEAHYSQRGEGEKLNDARKRMALIPEGAEVWATPGMWVPLVVKENVHIFPGVPRLFEMMLRAAADRFSGVKHHRVVLLSQLPEGDIADGLARIDTAFAGVMIGSYPQYGADVDHKVRVTFEGAKAVDVIKAAELALTTFGTGFVKED